MPTTDKLAAALAAISKEFGDDAIMKMDDSIRPIEAIPTGVAPLDIALGVGGIPRGRIIEIYGPESSGKTSIALSVAAAEQRSGGTVAFIDAEHALSPTWATTLGVDVSEMLVSQPDSGEQALEIVDMLIRSEAVGLIVVDSVSALTPKAEIEGQMGDTHVGLQARLMSQSLRKIKGAANTTGTTVIFINQLREKIGVTWGSSETTSGGRALKFYASIRLDVRRIGSLKTGGGEPFGNQIRAKVVKNKVAPPFRQAEFDLYFTDGLCRAASVVDMGVELGVIDKAGAWYAYNGEQIGQGKEKTRKFLREPDNEMLFAKIEQQVRDAAGIPT